MIRPSTEWFRYLREDNVFPVDEDTQDVIPVAQQCHYLVEECA